jgi:hypothetical protein
MRQSSLNCFDSGIREVLLKHSTVGRVVEGIRLLTAPMGCDAPRHRHHTGFSQHRSRIFKCAITGRASTVRMNLHSTNMFHPF